jgi:trimeric autotransporter adhesin
MSKRSMALSLVTAAVTAIPVIAAAPGALASGPAAADVISTVAGGVGGPAKATTVALASGGSDVCGVSYGGGQVQIGDALSVRSVNPRTDMLTTPAGTGVYVGPVGDGGPATAAAFTGGCGTAVDRHGNLLIAAATTDRVQAVAHQTGRFYGQSMTAGDIYTVAGDGSAGFSGNGHLATRSELRYPSVVAVDHQGNLVIADSGNYRVRVVAASTGRFYGRAMTAGHIYTVVGNGKLGPFGEGGPATKAAVFPDSVAVDGAGNLVITDIGYNRVRVVAAKTGRFYGQAMTAGHIYTVAGDGTVGFSGDGGPATAAELNQPAGVAVDGAGNLVIADFRNARVRVVAASTGTFYGRAMTVGDIYTVAGDGTYGHSGDGGPATAAELEGPAGVALDGSGNLLIGDSRWVLTVPVKSGTYYRRAMTAGHIYKVAGNLFPGVNSGEGHLATRAEFTLPEAVAVDGRGDLLISVDGRRVKAVAARTGTFWGQPMTAGHIYTVAGDGRAGFSGDGGPAVNAEVMPASVTADGAGNLVIADEANNRVRVVAASTGRFYGKAMTAGDIYTVAGDGSGGFSGDGGPATAAALNGPQGVTVDAVRNLVIADTFNERVRVVAASTGRFYGQAMTAGDIYTVAGDGRFGFSGDGGPATAAELNTPEGMRVDGAGNLVIADWGNNRVRVVAARTGRFYGQAMTAGDIYTVAGDGSGGFSGDGGPATAAELNLPSAVAVDGAGNLVIADSGNYRVRVVAASTGRFYGRAMTAGDIYTAAGDGSGGFSGDGGPASAAELNTPNGVAVNAAGDLLIADETNNRVREVQG